VTHGFQAILPFLKPIEHLLLDDAVSEIMVNGADRIFIEKGGVLERVREVSLGERALLVAVKNIARRLGDDISESKPILDSRLPDGSRVAAVIPPCSLGGVTLTIRKFRSRRLSMDDLILADTLDCHLAARLEDYIRRRKNVLVSGGTGTGKSTLASALAAFIPPEERIVLIEDTAELQLPHTNLVRFEARREQNGLPAVTVRDLLKASLRHRPDRIVLGEIRSGEAFDLLQLLNTGHAGTLSTIHANSARRGLARFASCVLQSGVGLPHNAIKVNIGDSVDVLVHVERRPGRRFISEVLELKGYDLHTDRFDYAVVYVKDHDHEPGDPFAAIAGLVPMEPASDRGR
jgi:pilus assembly protein CpaF